jgi:hypothetical protein
MKYPDEFDDVDDIEDVEVLIPFLDIVWNNIQHNEKIRNRSFELYVAVVAGFLLVMDYSGSSNISNNVMLAYSILVSVLGLFMLWTIVRLRPMIERDVSIIKKINRVLSSSSTIFSYPLADYDKYFVSDPKPKLLSRWSNTSSDLSKVAIISSGMSTLSLWIYFDFHFAFSIILFFLFIVLQYIFVQILKKLTPSMDID